MFNIAFHGVLVGLGGIIIFLLQEDNIMKKKKIIIFYPSCNSFLSPAMLLFLRCNRFYEVAHM